jgi:hypothetical protein
MKKQNDLLESHKIEFKKLSNIHISKIIQTKFPNWDINNKSILEYSKTFKIKYNIIINIGLSIGFNYNKIKNEILNPSSLLTNENHNIYYNNLINYISFIYKTYYLIKFHDFAAYIPYDLLLLLKNNSIKELHSKLPELDSTILNRYNYYKNNSVLPDAIINFLLHTITNTILVINENLKSINITKYQNMIKYINDYIFNNEEMISIAPAVIKTTIKEIDNYDNISNSDSESNASDESNESSESSESDAEINDENDIDIDQDNEYSIANIDLDADVDNEDNIYKSNDD